MTDPVSNTSRAPAAASPDDEIDLGRLFGLLLDHKWWIAGITALFMLGGAAYALLSTPIFQADALVQVEQRGGVSNPLSDMRDMLGQEPRAEAELEILRSRMVLGRVVEREQLEVVVHPHRLPIVGDFLVRRGWERPDWAGSSVWAGESLEVANLRVVHALEGRTFTLEVIEPDQYRLFLGDEALGEGSVGEDAEFMDGGLALRVSELDAAPRARFNLVRQPRLSAINSLRNRFEVSARGDSGVFHMTLTSPEPEQAQRSLNAISEIFLLQNVQRQSAEAEQSLEFLDEQVPRVREQLREAEDVLNAYRTERDSVDLSQETRSVLERLVNLERQLNELEFQEAEIARRYTPSHPTYAALLEKRSSLDQERARLNEQVADLPETQQQILRLSRDVEVNQAIYVQLLNRMQEMRIAQASTVGNVRILDDAAVSPGPVEPKRSVIVASSTVLGVILAVGLVLLRGLVNRGVESQEEIEAIDIPVYASIPRSQEQEKLLRQVKRKRSGRHESGRQALLAQVAPGDQAIEALRGLRTSLHFGMLEASNNRIAITGPSPNIGKSFVTLNLGAVCAQGGQKVLVVDADLRKGHAHQTFGDPTEGGLSDMLSGRASVDDITRSTDVDGLAYVGRGSAPPNPAELLMSERFSEFLRLASERYDLVLVDTPPILAVTDASIVGRQCATTLMVVRFQQNPVREIAAARRRLESAGIETRGAILNAVEFTASTNYGYGYYHYSYKSSGTEQREA
ncbi:polysaccharide biosynthesis tyrosine autokinase [Thioalkalivibrio sp. ALMg13-2]|uniref:polysaccharide biosynthesis tyrosine autokinase n=1 Tax=Thioalkalivibrio sp. ALMg13-2 TaxID=1158167 RepID=UPI000360804B|nr:polysaccharide biosynthesis tyrosine autokinase [Thioalkalivibrio sp. ALMg13-2]